MTKPDAQSWADRVRDKQASRAADQRALESGQRSAAELQRENGAFSFPNAEIDYRRTKLY